MRATKVYHEPLERAENIEFLWDSVVDELIIDKKVIGARVKNLKSDAISELSLDGLFVSIGRKPATELFSGVLRLDAGGYILADESTKTNIDGVYAVGDVRAKVLRQVVTAVSDGAVAVHFAEEYLAASKPSVPGIITSKR